MRMFHYYNLSYSEVFIFDDYLINQIKEGEEITYEHTDILNDIIERHFSNRNLVYLSNRIKSYSVNPLIYKEVEKISNLLALIIICDEKISMENAEFEKKFYDKPYKVCTNLSEAITWVDKIIYN